MQNDLFGAIDAAASQAEQAQPPLLEFFNTNKESVGRVEFTHDGFLTFEGDVDEAAKKFFEGVITYNSERIIAYRNALQEIKNASKETSVHVIVDRVL